MWQPLPQLHSISSETDRKINKQKHNIIIPANEILIGELFMKKKALLVTGIILAVYILFVTADCIRLGNADTQAKPIITDILPTEALPLSRIIQNAPSGMLLLQRV